MRIPLSTQSFVNTIFNVYFLMSLYLCFSQKVKLNTDPLASSFPLMTITAAPDINSHSFRSQDCLQVYCNSDLLWIFLQNKCIWVCLCIFMCLIGQRRLFCVCGGMLYNWNISKLYFYSTCNALVCVQGTGSVIQSGKLCESISI